LLKNSIARRVVPAAAKAGTENRALIAAVNRCATQKREQNRVFQQTANTIGDKLAASAKRCRMQDDNK
jgi:hypothetical protein